MAEIIKISSPVEVKNRIQNIPKTQTPGQIFDIQEPDGLAKDKVPVLGGQEEDHRQELLNHLSKELHQPLMEQTKAGAESIRKLILYAKLFQVASGVISEDFLTEFFVLPKELLGELQGLDDAASIFKGDFFEAIRGLAKSDNFPELKPLILNILKAFDSYIGKDVSLKFVEINTDNLIKDLTLNDAKLVTDLLGKLQNLMNDPKLVELTRSADLAKAAAMLSESPEHRVTGNLPEVIELAEAEQKQFEEISNFLKNELIPNLRNIALSYPPADKVQDSILNIIHYVVRFDKADPSMLDKAFNDFAEELRPLFPHLSSEDIEDMKETFIKDANLLREEISSPNKRAFNKEGRDLASLLERALDQDSPAKIAGAGRELLQNLVQSESPMQPLLHFLIPLRFRHEDTYGEFFIDKDCEKRKGGAKEAINIFFTIQSDLYGTFEVDLLARDTFIELDIKCPKDLVRDVNNMRNLLRDSVEAAGYRLSNYKVEEYQESTSIIRRFPELMNRRSGVDVRI